MSESERFPFLIGRIRTKYHKHLILKGVMKFPFLIGRIRTEKKTKKELVEEMFPFLIGRIRTLPKA